MTEIILTLGLTLAKLAVEYVTASAERRAEIRAEGKAEMAKAEAKLFALDDKLDKRNEENLAAARAKDAASKPIVEVEPPKFDDSDTGGPSEK